jgi:hypothetical protein
MSDSASHRKLRIDAEFFGVPGTPAGEKLADPEKRHRWLKAEPGGQGTNGEQLPHSLPRRAGRVSVPVSPSLNAVRLHYREGYASRSPALCAEVILRSFLTRQSRKRVTEAKTAGALPTPVVNCSVAPSSSTATPGQSWPPLEPKPSLRVAEKFTGKNLKRFEHYRDRRH